MESIYEERTERYARRNADFNDNGYSSELVPWFLVSGDTEDFIFYGEPDRTHSEK